MTIATQPPAPPAPASAAAAAVPVAAVRGALYALFVLSGFAGLIYESIWTHYLKLFLGHAAYAQTLVLAIFMGGMALGAWLAGERSRRWRQPLLAYALVEGVLGVLAFAFDPVFRGMQAWAFDSAIPALPGPRSIDALKWGLATLLILPQCVLLGMTFPLMSAGVVRLAEAQPGRVLGWLYFTNSLGAAAGVLASGFLLIAAVGLPGTIRTAGLLNLAIVAMLLPLLRCVPAGAVAPPVATPASGAGAPARLLLAAAFLTGMASFFYEIGWIRMLSLVLGSATHSFELMLAGFILGLALGSAWIRPRIDGMARPLLALGWIQAVMALFALLSLALYGRLFVWMEAFISNVARTDVGYIWFNLFSQLLCLALMLPVTICAGMTLPLITATLLRQGAGEAAIGRVYAVNTAGAIAGILLAVHFVMPVLGLRQVVIVGAVIDLGLGLWLLRGPVLPHGRPRAALALLLLAATLTALLARFEPAKLASGVFRYGSAENDARVLFHRDGKTASVDVLLKPSGALSIATNGKIDAAMAADAPSPDDHTMVMLAAVPLVLHARPREVAVIGFGSGRTTHALLHDPRLARVDTVEIEPAMVEGARLFGPRVRRAYEDPRSSVHYEDAKTFFARERRAYDVIVSEPSNPWVSGVASLFSTEFYAQARRSLAPGGLFVQWLQVYEIDPARVATVMEALGAEFADYQIYAPYDGDLIVVARADGTLAEPSAGGLEAVGADLRALMQFVGQRTLDDLRAARIGGKEVLAPFFHSFAMPANSDYFPVLDQHAVRDRFLGANAAALTGLQPFAWRLEGVAAELPAVTPNPSPRPRLVRAEGPLLARVLGSVAGRGGGVASAIEAGPLREIIALLTLDGRCGEPALEHVWLQDFLAFADARGLYLSAADARTFVAGLRRGRCFASAPAALREWVGLFEAVSAGDHAGVRARAPVLLASLDQEARLPDWAAAALLEADLRAGEAATARQRVAEWGARADSYGVRLMAAHAAATEGEDRVR